MTSAPGTPRVSVLVTSYNQARYVEQALDSLRQQTSPDFEVIITDDASTDGSADVIDGWLARTGYPAQFIRNPVNRGICANRNTALAHGILAGTGSQTTTTVTGVEVRNFPTESGIRVADGAVLTIGAGTNVHNTGSISASHGGLHVTGTGRAIIASTTDAISFHANAFAGIGVDSAGSVAITGTPGTTTSGTVVSYSNVGPGILVAGFPTGGQYPTLSTITGLVSYSNTGDGARIIAGSNVKVRGSRFYSNLVGVTINQAGSGALPYNDDTSRIDFGSNASSDPGNNVIQSPTLVDAGAALANANAGLCISINPNKSQTLQVIGNVWANATSTGSINCALVSPGALSKSSTCAGGVDIGGGGQNGNTIAILNCN